MEVTCTTSSISLVKEVTWLKTASKAEEVKSYPEPRKIFKNMLVEKNYSNIKLALKKKESNLRKRKRNAID